MRGAASSWADTDRIVEENGVTYRVGTNGTRVQLTPNDSRIVVENGVRYRVDPTGDRHRINDRGLRIDLPGVPGVDVDVGTNSKGHLDVDVNTQGGDATPNH